MAFLPIPPMLIPEIAAGAADDLREVRTAAQAAVAWVCQWSPVAVLLPHSPLPAQDWSLNGFGVPVGGGHPVGLAQGVAMWLLTGRSATFVGPGSDLRDYRGVLVMGDGSAARTDKAPGHNLPEAVPFDDAVVAALRGGDAASLRDTDLELADRVMAAGAPAWVSLARAVDQVETAELDVSDDPFGVLYTVARWTVRWAAPA